MCKTVATLAALFAAAAGSAWAQGGEDEFRRRAEEIERKFERSKKEMLEQLERERKSALQELERSLRKDPPREKDRPHPGMGELGSVLKELFGLVRELRAEIAELREQIRRMYGRDMPPPARHRDAPRHEPPPKPKKEPEESHPFTEGRWKELMKMAEELKKRLGGEENPEERDALRSKLERLRRQIEKELDK